MKQVIYQMILVGMIKIRKLFFIFYVKKEFEFPKSIFKTRRWNIWKI